MNLSYLKAGDYQIPALKINQQELNLNHYSRLRKNYLKESQPALYMQMIITGELQSHLIMIGQKTEEMLEMRITELLKAQPGPDKVSRTRSTPPVTLT